MREFCADHIKTNSACDRFFFRDEVEARVPVDEAFDEPNRRQAINEQVATSKPPPPLVLLESEPRTLAPNTFSEPLVSVLRSSESFLATVESCRRRRTTGSVEEVNRYKPLQFVMQLIKFRLVTADPCVREMAAPLLLSDAADQTLKLAREL